MGPIWFWVKYEEIRFISTDVNTTHYMKANVNHDTLHTFYQIGSQYLFTDHGVAPERSELPSMMRKELGLVRFSFSSGRPSNINVWIPTVNTTGSSAVVWQVDLLPLLPSYVPCPSPLA